MERSVPTEAWRPSLCSICTELSLSLSRCACLIFPSASWTTWWAQTPLHRTADSSFSHSLCRPQCIPIHLCGINVSIFARVCINMHVCECVRMLISPYEFVSYEFISCIIIWCRCACASMLVHCCIVRLCICPDLQLYAPFVPVSVCAHTWSQRYRYRYRGLDLVHVCAWWVFFLLFSILELVNQSHVTH